MRKLVDKIGTYFPLEKIPVGEFEQIKVNGMKFTIEQYEAKGLGNVSVMCATGFFGLMKMDTLIINPSVCDAPLFSYDRILAMGNDTLIIELYDTVLGEVNMEGIRKVKEAYAALPERDPGQHWYDNIKYPESISKKGKKKESAAFDSMTEAYLSEYLELAKCSANCEETQKLEKASVYVEGLLTNGGPSTDVFKKHYGEEKTAYLFRNILFGTQK